jgi:hypothetical protein
MMYAVIDYLVYGGLTFTAGLLMCICGIVICVYGLVSG